MHNNSAEIIIGNSLGMNLVDDYDIEESILTESHMYIHKDSFSIHSHPTSI